MTNTTVRDAAYKHRDLILKPYDALMEMDGFDAVCAMSDMMGGCSIYIPTVRKIFQACLEEEARRNFKGDYRQLSRKYGLSERHLRRVING